MDGHRCDVDCKLSSLQSLTDELRITLLLPFEFILETGIYIEKKKIIFALSASLAHTCTQASPNTVIQHMVASIGGCYIAIIHFGLKSKHRVQTTILLSD